MKKKTVLLAVIYCFFFTLRSQTIINTATINKYANVLKIDYCQNALIIPSGLGNQFSIGDKILIIQMKGASLKDGNNIDNGKIDNYNNAGNYEINEIKSINSSLNEIIVFKYELKRFYNISGFVQIVNIPQYDDVVIQNTLSCLPWNGNYGGILAFKATGTITMNADINISEKGFRGGIAEDLSGTNCFGIGGFQAYNCDYSLACGALKGEGIGDKYETKELARTPNANGGGGGNDHNAGGGGGGAFGNGGKGGERTNGGCTGLGGFGGLALEYNNSLNKLFFTGGGGAGDAGNADGSVGATSGGNAGGLAFITANSIKSNSYRIISNGGNVTGISANDGAGGGGAGGGIVLNINTYTDVLSIELKGGEGGSGQASSGCTGPGGGGSGGYVWIKQANLLANINLNATGGIPGMMISGICAGTNNGAVLGEDGGFFYNFNSIENNKEFIPLTLNAGNDTILCGNTGVPLWAKVTSSINYDFIWSWSSGTETEENFSFKPNFSGNYNVTAIASYNKFDTHCEEVYIVHIGIREPKIDIVASSFSGDTIKIGDVFFINALITPANESYTYSWTPKNRIEPNNDRNAIATPYQTGEYCLSVKDEDGCANSECITLYVYEPKIISPNAFSPNNDALNNTFFPIITDDLKVVSFRVYNRWGDLVYNTTEKIAWDGKKDGKILPSDLYIWYLDVVQDLSELSFKKMGNVSIVR